MLFTTESAEWYILLHISQKIENQCHVKADMKQCELKTGKLWISGVKRNLVFAKQVISKKFSDLVICILSWFILLGKPQLFIYSLCSKRLMPTYNW